MKPLNLFRAIALVFFTFCSTILFAQQLTQTVRGVVMDNLSSQPLPGVNVIVYGTNPLIGAVTDMDGQFRIVNVPIGSQTLIIQYTGYKTGTIQNLEIKSGKEMVLNIPLEEDIAAMGGVEIVAESDKQEAVNSMSGTSTRTFSVEETQKFAAAINDPGRMALSFAGVQSTDDGNNNISIRGNSPFGLLWRMEGVDIPSPNHFAAPATSGGGISILSSQLLSNSDFMTGAFSAEYGNALSGVFDLKLRKGNNEKREYTFQAGFMGIDAAVEGPIRKGYDGSFLINYRYSTLSLLSNIGVNVGDGITNFQDLSFHVYMPTKKSGTFSLFGFGGLSDQQFKAESDSSKWEYRSDREQGKYVSNTMMAGLKHLYIINDHHYIQSIISGSGVSIGYELKEYDDDVRFQETYNERFEQRKLTYNTTWNWKKNARHHFRTGVYLNLHQFNLYKNYLDELTNEWLKPLDASAQMRTAQAFSQWKYRITDRLQFLGGLHFITVLDNGTYSLEPRGSLKYTTNNSHTWSAGYGLHSQVQPIGVYHGESINDQGYRVKYNENLEMNKAHHFVVGYDHRISKFLHAKLEAYYQHLFNIAVEDKIGSSLSSLNMEYDFILEPFNNKGLGRNKGIELTVEQFTKNGLYFLLSGSIFQSEYKAMDGKWHNTRFNSGRTCTFTGGKEWKVGKSDKHKTLGVNLRLIYTGGLYATPIDLAASVDAGTAVYDETRPFSEKAPDYMRADLKISLKKNKVKTNSTLSLDIQNVMNRQNIGGRYFNAEKGLIETWTMVPLIPVLSYKIEF